VTDVRACVGWPGGLSWPEVRGRCASRLGVKKQNMVSPGIPKTGSRGRALCRTSHRRWLRNVEIPAYEDMASSSIPLPCIEPHACLLFGLLYLYFFLLYYDCFVYRTDQRVLDFFISLFHSLKASTFGQGRCQFVDKRVAVQMICFYQDQQPDLARFP